LSRIAYGPVRVDPSSEPDWRARLVLLQCIGTDYATQPEAEGHRPLEGADGLGAHPVVHDYDDFDAAFGVDEWHRHNAFIRDGDRVFRTHFSNGRGDEVTANTWSYLDMTALGRQEQSGRQGSRGGHPGRRGATNGRQPDGILGLGCQ
jgi:hypothetical protein